MNQLLHAVQKEFIRRFNTAPVFVRSPGRVNLIGEHTDYNEGFVLPAAIDKQIVIGIAPNGSSQARIYAQDKDESFTFDVNDNNPEKSALEWPNYIMGVVQQLREDDWDLDGFDCVFGGDIPIGAGLSSSAALEEGVIFGLDTIFDLGLPPLTRVKLGQRAENQFVGVQCGIMDQFANVFGRDARVFKLDCRTLDFEYYPFERDDLRIVLCDTQVRRSLATSEYNIRRSQCEQGVELVQQYDESIRSLRDVPLSLLRKHQEKFDPIVYRRCEYVIQENTRVEQACKFLEEEDYTAFGQQMYDSHAGLRDQYEVSSKELDYLVDIASDIDGVYGSRMMGAGFGGCTINLVHSEALDAFSETIREKYSDKFQTEPLIYVSRIRGGTSLVESELVESSTEMG